MGSGKKSPSKQAAAQVAPSERGRGRVTVRVVRDPAGGWRVVQEGA